MKTAVLLLALVLAAAVLAQTRAPLDPPAVPAARLDPLAGPAAPAGAAAPAGPGS